MQFLPEQSPQPAVAEAARVQQLHLREHNRDGVEGVGGNWPVIGEEAQLARSPLRSSKTEIVFRHAACWLSLISPR